MNIKQKLLGFIDKKITKINTPNMESSIEALTNYLSNLSIEDRAYFFADATLTRSGLQSENYLKLPDGTPDYSANVNFWMSNFFWDLYEVLNKKNDNYRATQIEFWYWTTFGITHPNIHRHIKEMWNSIIESKPYWSDKLDLIYQQKVTSGELDLNDLNIARSLAIKIFAQSPPKYLKL